MCDDTVHFCYLNLSSVTDKLVMQHMPLGIVIGLYLPMYRTNGCPFSGARDIYALVFNHEKINIGSCIKVAVYSYTDTK